MSKSFSTLSTEEKDKLIQDLCECLTKNDIKADVQAVTEVVCDVKGDAIDHKVSLVVKKDMPSTDAAKAKEFNDQVKPIIEGITGVKVSVVSKLAAGDKYQEITDVVKISEDAASNLTHKEGEVWLLDFWATWCPPCQKPMQHNIDMLEKRGAEWGSNVRIIGLSIDQTKDAVVKHVEAKKWGAVEHYHRATSKCSEVYGVSGVPHVMLIDKQGTIVFKGHPAGRPDLEADLTTLSKGEALTGEGIAAASQQCKEAPKADEPVKEGFKKIDLGVIDQEITAFMELACGFQNNDELREAAKGMERSFCVLTVQTDYLGDAKNTVSKYCNYRVLVGKQESIDMLQKAFEDVKGSFEIINNVHPK